MQPWWVITFLADEGELSNASFAHTLNEQLKTWSRINGLGERWWAVDAFSDDDAGSLESFAAALKKFIRNPLHREVERRERSTDQEPLIQGDIDATKLFIALVGDVTVARTRRFLHCLASMLRLRGEELFHGTTINITALIYVPLTTSPDLKTDLYRFATELETQASDDVVARRPFDALLVAQERNQINENRDGYVALTPEQVRQSMAQSLFHLMLGEGRALAQLKQTHRCELASIGAAAVYYDWELFQRKLAKSLGEELIKDFAQARSSPFVDVEQAQVSSREVADRADVKRLFQQLALGPGRPVFNFGAKIWQGAKTRRGRIISAWTMFSKEILYTYFSIFLKNLPFRISEYARIFLYANLEQFREFLRARRTAAWEGSEDPPEQGLRRAIRAAITGVLEGRHGGARTLGQIKQAADEIKAVCDPAQARTRLAMVDEFARLEVFAIPDFLRDYYDRAENSLTADEEKALYERMVDTIRSHPLPAALLLRAVVIGILAALIVYPALSLISPQVLNLEWLLEYPWLVRALSAALPLAFAFWRYRYKTVMTLRKQLLTYVAAVLKHAQTQAREMVRQEMGALLVQAQGYCEEIKKWADGLGGEIAYPAVEFESYSSTAFQREVFEGFQIPGQPRSSDEKSAAPAAFALEVAGQQKPFEQFSGLEKNVYLRQFLDSETGGTPLWEMISALIPPTGQAGEQGSGGAGVQTVQGFTQSLKEIGRRWREFAEGLYRDVSKRRLDSFLEEAAIQKMRALSFPPAVLASGVNARGAIFELKYGDTRSLAQVTAADFVVDVPCTSLASLAGYRPIERITDISLLRTFAQHVDGSALQWNALSSLFTAATTRLPGENRPGLKNLADDRFLSMEAFEEQIIELRKKLGIHDFSPPKPKAEAGLDEEKAGGPELEI